MAIILIVEDSDNVAPLEIALGAIQGLATLVLPDGSDALELLAANSVELAAVITDLHLPRVDGFDLVAAIRSQERYAKLPIVVVSGDDQPDICSRIFALGANAFFVKPYSPAKICDRLKELLYAS